MTCPKCRSNVPDASPRCPSCGLGKPKARPVDPNDKPARRFMGRDTKQKILKRTREKPRPVNQKPAGPSSRTKRVATLLSLSMILVVLAGAAYWFIWPLLISQGPEPQTAALVLEKLRKMPSNEEGLTVEQSVDRELEKSRRVGNLVGYQGWTVREAPGDKSKLLVIFSFDERDNSKRIAEWLADPVSSTYIPQTELAAAVFKP